MTDDLMQTIRLQRNAKVGTDSQGRSVWTKPIEPTELELVSTIMLKKILTSDDEDKKQRIRDVAQGKDGVLAQNTSTADFEIISDEELQAAIEGSASAAEFTCSADIVLELASAVDGEQELSLVTTQTLRRLLGDDDHDTASEANSKDDPVGYNPYDSG